MLLSMHWPDISETTAFCSQARSIQKRTCFDSGCGQFLISLAFYSMFYHAISSMLSSCFFIFHPIQKFITPWILIQMRWGFLHDVHHDLYYFLMIFPEIMHAWILMLLRDCVYMCFLDMPCHFGCEMMRFYPTLLKFFVLKIDILRDILV